MRLLYPNDPFNKKKPDETYEEEFNAAALAGLPCSLYSAEDFELGEFKPCPDFSPGDEILYRGWMLTPENYSKLQTAIENKGGKVVTTTAQYRRCHYLPEWYDDCEDLTPATVFLKQGDDFARALADRKWQSYFVKDYVKSLTTKRGSIASSVDEITEIVALIRKFRGQVEGGVCVREFENLIPESEERYFIFKKKAFSSEGEIPRIVEQVVERIRSPFFSVDVCQNTEGVLRLIELGDGQVSDRKKWSAERFISMLNQ